MTDILKPILSAVDAHRTDEGKQHYAVFDFDNTCIKHDIQEALLTYMCRHSLIRNEALMPGLSLQADREAYNAGVFRHYYELLTGSMREGYTFIIRTLAGFRQAEIDSLVTETIREEGDRIGTTELFGVTAAKGLHVRESVIELMTSLQARGIGVWAVSASAETAVRSALRYYKLPAQCIGMNLKEVNGVFEDELIEPFSIAAGKVICIKKYIGAATQPLLGIGDSMNDLPMLEYSHVKVVVDRGNALAKEARKRGWYLIPE